MVDMDASIIKKIIDAIPPGTSLESWIGRELLFIEVTKKAFATYGRQSAELRMKHDQEMRQLETTWQNEIAHMQSMCPHYDIVHFSDPAGGSDSSTVCNTCGKEL
jgi:hypothetical protein